MLSVIRVLLIIAVVLIVLYFLMIMPRMTHRPDRSAFETKLYAHRGLYNNRSDAPENSMNAFSKAVAAGYGIELDVQMTKDKVPVVFHDFTLKRMCTKPGKVSDYTFEELQTCRLGDSDEKIPTFREFLRFVDGRVPLIIEYKVERKDLSVCRICDEMLRSYKGVYCVESFNPLVLIWYRRKHSTVMRGQLSEAFLHNKESWTAAFPFLFMLQMLLEDFVTKPDFIAYNHLHERNPSRRLCHGFFHAKAAAWTIKSEEQLKKAEGHFDVFIFDSFIPGEGSHSMHLHGSGSEAIC